VAAAPLGGAPRFDVGSQHAADINMAGRDQYNYQQHFLQVQQVRESFLRDVAASKSKARTLIWMGLLVFVAGFVVYGVVFARAASAIGKGLSRRREIGALALREIEQRSTARRPHASNTFARPVAAAVASTTAKRPTAASASPETAAAATLSN
jgi:hypothetical protein